VTNASTSRSLKAVALSWNSTGPTPTLTWTPTLGMCLLHEAYVYSTRIHIYMRASLMDIFIRIFARKSAHVGQVDEDRHMCPVRGKLNGEIARHADDILATSSHWSRGCPCQHRYWYPCRSRGIPALLSEATTIIKPFMYMRMHTHTLFVRLYINSNNHSWYRQMHLWRGC